MTEPTSLSFACRHRYAGGFELDLSFRTDAVVTALFGPTGSGKTTILSIVAGLLNPSRAVVKLDATTLIDTESRTELPPERRGIGYVFQDLRLFPHLSVEANLRYGRRRHTTADGPRIEFDKLVDVLELRELLDRSPSALSGGQRQRVALGRALLSAPRMLLMDEPLSSLDEPLKLRILDYLERIIDEWRMPTLFVSHSPAEVRRLAEHVIVLDRGRLVATGSPSEVPAQVATPVD